MTAVIWTDAIQMVLYIGGGLLSLALILHGIEGGWSHVWTVAAAEGKLRVFDFQFALSAEYFARNYTFWSGLIGGCFLTTASHGTEQLLVQRLLSARNEADSRRALLASWVVILFQFLLFLTGLPPPATPDRLYPAYVWERLPTGAAGLVVAAILAAAMSTLSSSVSSLATTTVMDFYRPLAARRQGAPLSDAAMLRLGRLTTLCWGVLLFGVGLLARHWGSVLEAGLSVASVLYGSLLGVFLLGVLTRRAGERAAMAGMIAGFAVMMYVKFGTSIAWTWYVVIGAPVTFLVGSAAAVLFREPSHD
jgi:Na+/proline symporter